MKKLILKNKKGFAALPILVFFLVFFACSFNSYGAETQRGDLTNEESYAADNYDGKDVVTYGLNEEEKPPTERFFYKIALKQTLKMNVLKKYLSENKSFSVTAAIAIFMMTFIIGLIHSIVPGSGKIYAFSYFFSKDSPVGDAIKYGFNVMIIHTGITFIMQKALSYIELGSVSVFPIYGKYMLVISSCLIFILGWFLFFNKLGFSISKNNDLPYKETPSGLYVLAFFVAFAPCLAASKLAILTMNSGIAYNFIVLAGLAVGMSVGISIFAALSVLFKRFVISLASGSPTAPSPFKNFLELFALFAMTVVAIVIALVNLS